MPLTGAPHACWWGSDLLRTDPFLRAGGPVTTRRGRGLALVPGPSGRRRGLATGHCGPRVQYLADDQVVHQDPDHGTHQWAHDRYPPVVVEVRARPGERERPPALDVGPQPRTEIAGRVDGVARVRPEAEPDADDDQTDDECPEVAGRGLVALVDDRRDQGDQERGPHDLVQQRPPQAAGVVLGRERGEDGERVLRGSP